MAQKTESGVTKVTFRLQVLMLNADCCKSDTFCKTVHYKMCPVCDQLSEWSWTWSYTTCSEENTQSQSAVWWSKNGLNNTAAKPQNEPLILRREISSLNCSLFEHWQRCLCREMYSCVQVYKWFPSEFSPIYYGMNGICRKSLTCRSAEWPAHPDWRCAAKNRHLFRTKRKWPGMHF